MKKNEIKFIGRDALMYFNGYEYFYVEAERIFSGEYDICLNDYISYCDKKGNIDQNREVSEDTVTTIQNAVLIELVNSGLKVITYPRDTSDRKI